jgi:glycosyltransferase involved in cell wall biosynthesis
MPRIGRHPLKEHNLVLQEPQLRNITVTTITHIPILSGYWTESLAVLKLFFNSLFANTNLPFDLMVFDNASCSEVTDYLTSLKEDGLIQYLVLSTQNLRKLGALNFLFKAASGEYVAYADSDVYFLPGWLEKSMQVIKTFPKAGMVSALPTIDKTEKYIQSTRQGIAKTPNILVESGQDLIPEAFVKAHQTSLGKSSSDYFNGGRTDTRITLNGISAFLSAQDFQFLTRKAVIDAVLPLEVEKGEESYDPIYSPVLETKLDKLGYWRLSTTDYLVHHMGNSVPDLAHELQEITPIPIINFPLGQDKNFGRKKTIKNRILHSHILRKLIKKIYTWSYLALFEKNQ